MKHLLLIFLMSLPSAALAAPTPKDVADQMASGNTAAAETMTREILHDHPDSAKGHYYLGQILTREGKYREAYAELNKAASLDKSLSFASSDAKFREEMRKVEINIDKVDAPAISSESHAGRNLLIALALVLGFGGGAAWWSSACDRRKREAGRQRALSEQTSRLVALLDKAAALEVTVKLSDATDRDKKLASLADIRNDLNDLLAANRRQGELADSSSISRIERSLRQIEAGHLGIDSTAGESSEPATQEPRRSRRPQPARASYTAPPSPTVTNNYVSGGGSNDGFAEGVLLGEMMSGRENRTIVERETVVEKGDESDRDSFDNSRSDSFDTGGDSGFDSGSDSGFDSGSGDNNW